MDLELMPLFGGWYEYKHLAPADEVTRFQLAWLGREQARAELRQREADKNNG